MERKLIEEYSSKIYNIVNSMSYYDKDDLFQAGCIGLIKAYRNFDESMGVQFFSYAYKYILGEIRKCIRENRNIKVSRGIYTLNGKIEEAKNIISQKLMREPTIDELALFLEIDVNEIKQALSNKYTTTSLYTVLNDEGKETYLCDTIPDLEKMEKDDLILLKDSINKLEENDKKLINLRYINNYTQQETAKILGMSQVQVSRKENKVLQKLYKEVA